MRPEVGPQDTSLWVILSGGLSEDATTEDAARKADMRQMTSAQMMYYADNNAYFTSDSYPSAIGYIMTQTPEDPSGGPYGWIDNTGDSQKFCAYADLEKDGFFTATDAGVFEVAAEPRTFSDCY